MAQEGWKLEQEESACSPTPEAPKLCSNNCGFFGSSATMNLCSSCYRDLVLLKPKSASIQTLEDTDPQQQCPTATKHELPVSETALDTKTPSPSSSCSFPSSSPTACSDAIKKGSGSGSTSTSLRCFACNKKVGLRGFKCRCGDTFCSVHRYNDKHNCSFDYKAAGRLSIAMANPQVKPQKLNKI